MGKTKQSKRVKKSIDPMVTVLEVLIELVQEVKGLRDDVERLRRQADRVEPSISPLMPQPIYPSLPFGVGSNTCIDGGMHDYPFPWHATVPPCCKKCGRQAPSFQITCNGGLTAQYNDTTLTCDDNRINIDEGKTFTTEMALPVIPKSER